MRIDKRTWMAARWGRIGDVTCLGALGRGVLGRGVLGRGVLGRGALGLGALGLVALALAGCMEESTDLGPPDAAPQLDGQGAPGVPGPPGAPPDAGQPGPPGAGGTGTAGTGTGTASAPGVGATARSAGTGTAVSSGAGTAAPSSGAGTGTAAAAPASAPTSSAPASPSGLGSVPRVQKSLSDKPQFSQDELKASGKAIEVTGTVACYPCKATILLNITDKKGLLTTLTGVKPGSFTLYVPKSAGSVFLTAIGDDNSDGLPTAGEVLGAYMKNPLMVGESDLSDVSIEIGKTMGASATK